jgi:hypothetical protein
MGLVSMQALSRAVILMTLVLPASVWAQTGQVCRVLDPELQGVYQGGCENGLAEGRGEARGQAHYQGEFSAGRKHGKGAKTWPSSGDRYEGDFVDDRKEGKGTYVWGPRSAHAGERYTGTWLNDGRNGHGVYQWPNGERYDGEWRADRIVGPPTKAMVDRARVQAERAAAVARIGTRVCREMTIGVATRDTIRATVTATDGERITVRVENPGRFEHTMGDRTILKGDVITAPLRLWTPCG